MRNFMKGCLWISTVFLAFFTGRYVEWKDWHENIAEPVRKLRDELLEKYPSSRED